MTQAQSPCTTTGFHEIVIFIKLVVWLNLPTLWGKVITWLRHMRQVEQFDILPKLNTNHVMLFTNVGVFLTRRHHIIYRNTDYVKLTYPSRFNIVYPINTSFDYSQIRPATKCYLVKLSNIILLYRELY